MVTNDWVAFIMTSLSQQTSLHLCNILHGASGLGSPDLLSLHSVTIQVPPSIIRLHRKEAWLRMLDVRLLCNHTVLAHRHHPQAGPRQLAEIHPSSQHPKHYFSQGPSSLPFINCHSNLLDSERRHMTHLSDLLPFLSPLSHISKLPSFIKWVSDFLFL